MPPLTQGQQQAVIAAVTARFEALVASLNAKDSAAWAAFYSDTAEVSAVAGTDVFLTKQDWTRTVGAFFAERASQSVTPLRVTVRPLADDLALLVSQEDSDITLGQGRHFLARHVFTMLWANEADGWKIVHSHESWQDAADPA